MKVKKILRKIGKKLKSLNLPKITIKKFRKKLVLAVCSVVIAAAGIGMASIPHEEKPVAPELLEEAMAKEVAEEPEKIVEEVEELKVCEEGCTLEEGHEGDCAVKKEDVKVILKSTSMERDLKVKFVNEATGKVISGAAFKMQLTDSSKKTKEYSDHDNDGIIWVKDIEGGSYTVTMMELEGYVTAKTMSSEVKKKIEYKIVEVADEVKTEKEVVVSQEDGDYGGADKDESTSNSAVLKDTVEFVASKKEEKTVATATQKLDEFNQPMYEKYKYENGQRVYKELKKDEFGTPMYSKILSEPAKYHEDPDGDGKCNRCSANMPKKECTHKDDNNDGTCDLECGASGLNIHQHTVEKCKCTLCGKDIHGEITNGICKNCDTLIKAEEHKECVDDGNGACKYCTKTIDKKECTHSEVDAGTGNCKSCNTHVKCVDGADEDTLCDRCGTAVETEPTKPLESTEPTENAEFMEQAWVLDKKRIAAFGIAFRPFSFLRTGAEPVVTAETAPVAEVDKIVYDTKSTPIYDTKSAPVYDTSSAKVYETKTTTVYYGWQTIDGATYYFDKNGNKVTGQQVIQGVSYTFNSEGIRSGTIGIDVSKYQRNINWTKIKNAGINFVMIRCGYRGYGSGVLVQDEMFASHITGAKAAGLRVGIYFFSQAINEAEAVEEASMAVSLAQKYGINMPIAIDSEYANGGRGRADGLSKSARTAVTKAFCNTVKNSGYTPMVYASKSWFGSKLDVSRLSSYRIWVAHYSDKCGYTGTYHIWQHTDKGKVDGYSGYLDMNISSI